ncbi:hypothetical protein FRB99_008411 [Tulasnella sp. 403]|nr:hypothetical protein FRB99_008411 [Tulasnella sp. 403]
MLHHTSGQYPQCYNRSNPHNRAEYAVEKQQVTPASPPRLSIPQQPSFNPPTSHFFYIPPSFDIQVHSEPGAMSNLPQSWPYAPMPPPPLVQPPARFLIQKWERLESSSAIIQPFPGSKNQWLAQARNRRAAYAHSFALPSLRWVLVEYGENIPANAVQTGTEATGEPLYSIRAWHNGGLHLGKAGHHLFKGGSISWGSQEYAFGTFEVLAGDSSLTQWVSIPGTPRRDGSADFTDPSSPSSLSPLTLTPLASPDALPTLVAPKHISDTKREAVDDLLSLHITRINPFFAIEAGFEPAQMELERGGLEPGLHSVMTQGDSSYSGPSFSAEPPSRSVLMFIAQAYYAQGWHPGKVNAGDDHCCIGWGGGEVWVKEFRVLAWAL